MLRALGYIVAAMALWSVREALRSLEPTSRRETCPLCGALATTGAAESGVYCAAHEGIYRAAGEQRREA